MEIEVKKSHAIEKYQWMEKRNPLKLNKKSCFISEIDCFSMNSLFSLSAHLSKLFLCKVWEVLEWPGFESYQKTLM
jgi:hypothetical protein